MIETIKTELFKDHDYKNPLIINLDKNKYQERTFNKDLFDHKYEFNEILFNDMIKFPHKQIP